MSFQDSDQRGDRVLIRAFESGDEKAFRTLNEQWIKTYFRVEAKDEATFADPQSTIIEQGGQIFIADLAGESVGCCALLRMSPDEFEVAKMAVSPDYQGKGIGRRLLQAAIDEARRMGMRRLYLETNHQLRNAIGLYESLGFRHLDPSAVAPSAYDRADVYMEMMLG
ncbi:MAG: GNAT family N-acetyltransferase [Ignavibacteriota bacterium]